MKSSDGYSSELGKILVYNSASGWGTIRMRDERLEMFSLSWLVRDEQQRQPEAGDKVEVTLCNKRVVKIRIVR